MSKKELIVYFPNWRTADRNGTVKDIPWNMVTRINHAFFRVAPIENPDMSSFVQRTKGFARKNFALASIDAEADKKIFAEYEEKKALFPNVNIMVSVGGWCASGFFSEMAFTKEGRSSFIDSCVSFLKDHPFISGIDIDWEYPGGGEEQERESEGDWSEGCPVFGTVEDDKRNFSLLFKEMREAFEASFEEQKYITACSAAWYKVLCHQDWKEAAKWLNYVNIMSYDMSGMWPGVTGNASGVEGTKGAMEYFLNEGVPSEKINLGVAYYGTAYRLSENADLKSPLGAPITNEQVFDPKYLDVSFIDGLKNNSSWKDMYDEIGGGAYIFNDDPESEQYRAYISYEGEKSLVSKAKLVHDNSLAGIIVWEITQDSDEHRYTEVLSNSLGV